MAHDEVFKVIFERFGIMFLAHLFFGLFLTIILTELLSNERSGYLITRALFIVFVVFFSTWAGGIWLAPSQGPSMVTLLFTSLVLLLIGVQLPVFPPKVRVEGYADLSGALQGITWMLFTITSLAILSCHYLLR